MHRGDPFRSEAHFPKIAMSLMFEINKSENACTGRLMAQGSAGWSTVTVRPGVLQAHLAV
jgi:hypothetical protein